MNHDTTLNSANLIIRNETPDDVKAIHDITKAAFADDPNGEHTEHLIIDALRETGALSISLIAELEGVVVGHVAVSPVVISDGTQDWYGLGPISVLPELQGKGIGTQLIQHALAALKELGALGCVLVGEPGYYGRFGFKAEPDLVYPGIPSKYFQAISFDDRIPKGGVTYHESFYMKA